MSGAVDETAPQIRGAVASRTTDGQPVELACGHVVETDAGVDGRAFVRASAYEFEGERWRHVYLGTCPECGRRYQRASEALLRDGRRSR